MSSTTGTAAERIIFMLRNTHAAWGAASAVAVTQCSSIGQIIAVTCTGALGGVICDIDLFSKHNHKNRLARIILGIAAFIVLSAAVDFKAGTGIYRQIYAYAGLGQSAGIIGFIALCIIFMAAAHRKFSHSILACALSSLCVYLIYPPVCIAYTAGFISHLALDLLNRKPEQLFFPVKKGVCFNLMYSNRSGNTVLFLVGMLMTVIFLAISFMKL